MYSLQRRLNSDKGHVGLQKRTADCACVAVQSAFAQYSTIFKAISCLILKYTCQIINMHLRICILIIIYVTKCNTNLHPLFFVSKCKSVTGFVLVVHGFKRPEHEENETPRGKPLGVHISSCSGLSNPCTPSTHPVTITYFS